MAASFTWVTDTIPPDTELTDAPPLADNSVDVTFEFDSPDDALVQALDSAGAIPHGDHTPELNALLGLVTVPYFLPELRKNWPAWRPLVKDGKSNYIGPASVPMMALMHQRALLNSVFVRAAEEWLESGDVS